MKSSLIFSLLLYAVCAHAQSEQKEIDEQVWKPFIKYFNEHNTVGFMSVHSKDVVRSPRDSKDVWNWSEYNEQQGKGDKQELASNTKRTLELRFTEILIHKNLAVEVGVYKTSYGKNQNYYGRFHVVMRKEDGVWKIIVDTDSTESGTIGEKEFLDAKPMNN